MQDIVFYAALVVSLAVLVTAHVAIVYGLFARRLPGRAALSLVLVPLAPVWAFTQGMAVRGGIWIFALVLYGVAWILAR